MKALHDGYTARNATLEDLEPAVALMNAFSQHHLGADNAPPQAILKEWLSPGFEPGRDILLVFAPDGQMAGYIEVWTTNKPAVHPWVW
ncbi:MAG: hypothetical protein JW862_07320, partial [Anaerolineales bacterium]|nr:hypothetical protein [Anaerolineales bacterium]